MNDQGVNPSLPGTTQPSAGAARTAGQVLKAAREAAGLHVESLAMALKVPVYKLEALEADRHDLLPDMVFVRALASSICRTLRLEPAEVLALLPQTESPRLNQQPEGLNTPVKPGAGLPAGNPLQKGPLWLIGALLLGAGLIWWLPGDLTSWSKRTSTPVPPATATQQVPAPEFAAGAAPVVAASESAPPPSASSAPVLAPAPAAAPPVPVVSAGASAPVANPAAAAVAAPTPADAASMVLFRAKASSWVQVKDAAGGVVFQKTLAADETASVSGTPPLAVVVGRADATEVLVRGKPLSLDGLSRENVARFEVK